MSAEIKHLHADLYRFAALDGYSFRQRAAIRAADYGFYLAIKLVGGTIRYTVEGGENLASLERSGEMPIFAVWHDRIFLGTHYLKNRGIVFLASRSFDGEYIARFLQRFGFGVVRGSSTRGGARGLAALVRAIRKKIPVGLTVDGPKGPRYRVKAGAILLASKSECPILPFSVQPERFFAVGSWDRLQIPLPFSRARVYFGKPIRVAKNASSAELESALLRVQNELDALTAKGEAWQRSAR